MNKKLCYKTARFVGLANGKAYHYCEKQLILESNLGTRVSGEIQCSLGFATMGKAANLALATANPLTDLRQYIDSDLKFCLFCSK